MSESEGQSSNQEVPEHSVQAVEDTVVNDIMARQAHGEFPEVLPSEALTLGDITASVDDVLAWGKKIEHVLIQSYMDQRYRVPQNG